MIIDNYGHRSHSANQSASSQLFCEVRLIAAKSSTMVADWAAGGRDRREPEYMEIVG